MLSLTSLDLKWNYLIIDKGIQCMGLISLNLTCNKLITNEEIQGLSKLQYN